MATLAALALAGSIFGLSLTPPSIVPLNLDATLVPALEVNTPSLAFQRDALAALRTGTATETSNAQFVAQVRKRAKLTKVHRALGIATWATMTLAVASGTVQYRNLYGGGELGSTPCIAGDAWPSQSVCSGEPTGHLVLGTVTGALYATTLGLAYGMPDPDDASTGSSKFARRLRTHRALHWVHLAGMVTQMVLGPLIANSRWMGLDRTNDFAAMRALSAVHLSVGFVTWGALTAAGSLMLF